MSFLVVVALIQAAVLVLGVSYTDRLIEDHPYERGLVYQQVLNAASRAKEHGLEFKLEFERAAADGMRRAVITISAPRPLPVFDDKAIAQFKRPASGELDVEAAFRQEGAGRFVGSALLREPGLWFIEVRLVSAGKDYIFQEQVTLP